MKTVNGTNEEIIKNLKRQIELYKGIVADQEKIIILLKGFGGKNEPKT